MAGEAGAALGVLAKVTTPVSPIPNLTGGDAGESGVDGTVKYGDVSQGGSFLWPAVAAVALFLIYRLVK